MNKQAESDSCRKLEVLEYGEQSENLPPTYRYFGIFDAPFWPRLKKFGGMETSDLKYPKALEQENPRLKKLLVEYQRVFISNTPALHLRFRLQQTVYSFGTIFQ